MSASHRNSPYANSGMVVEIRPEDLLQYPIGGTPSNSQYPQADPLAGLRFQQELERLAFEHGGEPSLAPTQRLRDFVESRQVRRYLHVAICQARSPAALTNGYPNISANAYNRVSVISIASIVVS